MRRFLSILLAVMLGLQNIFGFAGAYGMSQALPCMMHQSQIADIAGIKQAAPQKTTMPCADCSDQASGDCDGLCAFLCAHTMAGSAYLSALFTAAAPIFANLVAFAGLLVSHLPLVGPAPFLPPPNL